jgi:hypothetical protein
VILKAHLEPVLARPTVRHRRVKLRDDGQLIELVLNLLRERRFSRSLLARQMGIDPARRTNVGRFSDGQRRYLEYHREQVLLRSGFLVA